MIMMIRCRKVGRGLRRTAIRSQKCYLLFLSRRTKERDHDKLIHITFVLLRAPATSQSSLPMLAGLLI